jgi:hypothetical protein
LRFLDWSFDVRGLRHFVIGVEERWLELRWFVLTLRKPIFLVKVAILQGI